ncbi:lycopene beta-cyclase CrtY [Noviherbaspirillum aerium]|uniref:lycopene beta-cyclase CrtY n=1 Tax=Noviherbaspirillum aerium TaxID=2588497 RepID=UPI00124BD6D3|nr:lycopene beta-cyclase CrtY [Noviherbaspirillum aerium]
MHDLILIGGGLANGLIAWRLRQLRPALRILLVERDGALGGNHTWSFYQEDLTPAQHAWIAPLVVRRWPGYEVRFPSHGRRLHTACYSIDSERFRQVLMQDLGESVMLDAEVGRIDADGAVINGRHHAARAVIDGRGHESSAHMRHAWQKFLGREVELSRPHGQAMPIIMDATVAQRDGYRFVYTLPFDERRILIEDTYYSTSPALDADALRLNLDAYAASRGWQIERVVREETGVLPIALSGDIERYWDDKPDAVPRSGLRAGLFHATTGYSLLFAVRLADGIAALDENALQADTLYRHIREVSVEQWRTQRFLRALNRMLFFAGEPAQRYRILQRFYTLPQQLIERFYAARLTRFDQLRILSGKPPVPVAAALRALCDLRKEPSSKPS